MEKVFILIIHVMSGSGDLAHQVMGPLPEHRCFVMMEEIMQLDSRVSESHALVLQCREATAAEQEKFFERQPDKTT
jgi:hypothetical protein